MIKIPQQKLIDIDLIKPCEMNTKKHPQTQINNIALSIKKYGFVQPLVLDKNNEIIIGHGRYFASKQIGLDKVPCVYVENLSDDEIRQLRIIDNKLNESEWDVEKLQLELQDINFDDFEDIDFGFNNVEIELEDDNTKNKGVQKKLLKCPVCGHINEEKAFKNYEDTDQDI